MTSGGLEPGIKDDSLYVDGQQLANLDLSGRVFKHFVVVGSRFENCTFDRTFISHANLGAGDPPSEFVDCSFDNARLRHIWTGNTRFVRCAFTNVSIVDLDASSMEFIECVFTGRIQKALFWGVPPTEFRPYLRSTNQFWGNDFSGAQLSDVSFRGGIDLRRQSLPSGRDYIYIADAAAGVARAREVLRTWNDSHEIGIAERTLQRLQAQVDHGQEQFFFCIAGQSGGQRLARLFGVNLT